MSRPQLALLALVTLGWPLAAWFGRDLGVTVALACFAAPIAALAWALGPRAAPDGGTFVGLGLGAVAGLLMAAGAQLGFMWVAPLWLGLEAEMAGLYTLLGAGPGPWARAALVGVVVLAEELVWREVLWRPMRERLGTPRAVVLVTASYTLAQLGMGSPALVAVALTCGLLWLGFRIVTDRLSVPIAAHLVFDALILGVWPIVG
ncbi:CPBP family intramembrane metalloprotease [Myxococcota bacterium]|nr:CPBP family intramembrane metalloprotease [Myxococcota bacterium]